MRCGHGAVGKELISCLILLSHVKCMWHPLSEDLQSVPSVYTKQIYSIHYRPLEDLEIDHFVFDKYLRTNLAVPADRYLIIGSFQQLRLGEQSFQTLGS